MDNQETTKPAVATPSDKTANETALATQKDTTTVSEKFVRAVERQFRAQLGVSIAWDAVQQTLAQNLFLKVDSAFKELQAKGKNVSWQNTNMQKLAIDAVHRVALGLDGSIPNHLHVIPYWSDKLKLNNIDLRIGYVGKVLVVKTMSLDPLIDVVYDLIYSTDVFEYKPRTVTNPIESYELKITNPFNRGDVVGGFFYYSYEDARKNRLILVNQRDFDRAEAAALTSDFWGKKDNKGVVTDPKSRIEMQMKTVVHRGCSKAILDPRKINAPSLEYVKRQEMDTAEMIIDAEALEFSNQEIISLAAGEGGEETTAPPGSSEEEQQGLALDAPKDESGPTKVNMAEAPAAEDRCPI